MKNSRGFLIAVAVILAVALVLFAAHTGLASTAQSNEEAAFSQMLELMMPGGAPFEELEYTGATPVSPPSTAPRTACTDCP